MNAVQCDSCKRIVDPESSVGWLKVQWIGIDVRTAWEPPGPFHFDSRKCLTEWALKSAGVTEEAT